MEVLAYAKLEEGFGRGVDGAGCFVEDEDFGTVEECADWGRGRVLVWEERGVGVGVGKEGGKDRTYPNKQVVVDPRRDSTRLSRS